VVRAGQGRGKRYTGLYTSEDVALLAEVDMAHGRLSGAATRKLLYRGWYEFADARYERLANISRRTFTICPPAGVTVSELWSSSKPGRRGLPSARCKPEPGGRPGYLRVDTVCQAIWMESGACTKPTWWMK
jgi:hypothetical protein